MIFSAVQTLGYNKICMGFNPRGVHTVHRDPDYNTCRTGVKWLRGLRLLPVM